MLQGKVIKGLAGFYYVCVETKVYECKLRGKLKLTHDSVLIGDEVLITVENNKGVVEKILPRKTELVRPTVANVDLAMLVFSLAQPEPVPELIDRLIINVEHAGITPLLIFTKADLAENDFTAFVNIYKDAGYDVLTAVTHQGIGLEEIRKYVGDKITVVAGPSGAGKSTLLNALYPGLKLKTGIVSAKIGRGRHTTRHVELLPTGNGGYIADTPGFSILFLPEVKATDLAEYYNDFEAYNDKCRFSTCVHKNEPGCAVKQALVDGKIDPGRYERYLVFLDQLLEKERKKYD